MDSSTSADESTGIFPAGYTAPRTTEQLMQYHKDHATHASVDPIIPMNNIEERLKLIKEIQAGVSEDQKDKSKDSRLTYFQLAYFLLCPDSALRKVIDDRFHGSYLEAQIQYISSFLIGTFKVSYERPFRDNSYREENTHEQNEEILERLNQLERGRKNLPQKKAEKEKCLVRDYYRCIFTQDESPKVYQILPFIASYGSWTFIQLIDAFSCFKVVLGSEVWSQLCYVVTINSEMCDKSWNMISLGPDLRKLWKEQFFGIQCLGILPIDRQASAIWLQFHWMPRNQRDYNDRAELNMDTIQKMLLIISPKKNDIVKKYRRRTQNPLETGHIVSIRMGKEEAISMKQVIDFRWVIARIGAISGHARKWSIFYQ
ncbi:hypothetical protein TGAM01_v204097 [Trichoderma gamsii]|uniref:HNH nuclease domain-containing protein n=1 Tax=Trichoderma gamsii TaxID=398673 RepID=A0A2P4ZSA1_9HYPO|nr:hypothetical protein TGAM01_v204097 [Trichoderma gamsii]PON27148.1 hypothetical protein TGAM01_v204097 [Trichoderma gamsii]